MGTEREVYLWVSSFSGNLSGCLNASVSSRYGRIEALSGFANGIFVILISIFIIFEAMQRLCVIDLAFPECLLILHQNGTPRDEHKPTSPSQLPWIGSQSVWD